MASDPIQFKCVFLEPNESYTGFIDVKRLKQFVYIVHVVSGPVYLFARAVCCFSGVCFFEIAVLLWPQAPMAWASGSGTGTECLSSLCRGSKQAEWDTPRTHTHKAAFSTSSEAGAD